MIEVLITLVIVSFGLLGAGALQLMSLQVNQNANQRSQAAMLAGSVLDAIRVNRYAGTAYNNAWGTAIPGPSATDIVQNDKHMIGTRIAEALPNGEYRVVVTPVAGDRPFFNVQVDVRWDEAGRLADRNETAVSPTLFTMVTQL